MTSVVVTGLPGDVKLSKLIFVFKNVLMDQKFWIRNLSDVPGTEHKEMTMEFESNYKAKNAQMFLDHFIFRSKHAIFPLRARLDDEFSFGKRYGRQSSSSYRDRSTYSYQVRSPHSYRDKSPHWGRLNRQHSRERSRSPLYKESSKLDLEIELLRKQRMVIEEERRLLLEKKKLELIRECGTNPSYELDFVQEPRVRGYPSNRCKPDYNEKPRYRPPRTRHKISQKKQLLPSFVLPCKRIISEMQCYIDEYSTKEVSMLVKLIRSTLRRRLAIALENKPRMQTDEIVALYRMYYPNTSDKSLITKMMTNIRESYLPSMNDDGNSKQQKNQSDGERYARKQKEGTSNTDDMNADNSGNSVKNSDQAAIDKNIEITNENALSLDASDIQFSLKDVDIEWGEDEVWNEITEDDEQLLHTSL